jgi:hypothetical protein
MDLSNFIQDIQHTLAAKTNISSCTANQRKMSQEELSRDKGIFHDVGGYV